MVTIAIPHLLHHHAPPAATAQQRRETRPSVVRRRIGPWTLEITNDPFGGIRWCRLQERAVSYTPKAMTFQFSRHENTFEAIYRIDQAPAVSWRVNAMDLAASGVPLQTETLDNPSGGRVLIPTRLLTGAKTVTIRASFRSRPRTFRLDGLAPALAVAATAGCGINFDGRTGR